MPKLQPVWDSLGAVMEFKPTSDSSWAELLSMVGKTPLNRCAKCNGAAEAFVYAPNRMASPTIAYNFVIRCKRCGRRRTSHVSFWILDDKVIKHDLVRERVRAFVKLKWRWNANNQKV